MSFGYRKINLLFLLLLVSIKLSAQDVNALLKQLTEAERNKDEPKLLADLYNKIGRGYFALKDYSDSKAAFEKELSLRRLLPDTGILIIPKSKVMYNLVALRRQEGAYESAFTLASESIILNEKHFGKKSQELADAHKQLAEVAFLWNRPLHFQKHFDIALQIQKSLIPTDTLKISDLLILQAGGYAETGDYEKVESVLREARFLLEKCSKKDLNLLARLYNSLGTICEYQNRLSEALIFSKKALDIRLSMGGELQTGVAWLYGNIGMQYQKQLQLEEAIIHYRKGLKIYRELLGPDNPKTLDLMLRLATALQEKGDLSSAKKIYEEIITADFEVTLFLAYRQLALIAEQEGNNNAAMNFLLLVEKDLYQQYGSQHPDLAAIYQDMALCSGFDNANKIDYLKKSLSSNRISGKVADKVLYLRGISSLLSLGVSFTEDQLNEAHEIGRKLLSECRQESDKQRVLELLHRFFEAELYYNSSLEKKDFQKIFQCFESGKSVLLTASFSESDAMKSALVPETLQIQYKQIKNNAMYFEQQWLKAEFSKDSTNMVWFRKEAAKYADSLNLLRSKLAKYYPEYISNQNILNDMAVLPLLNSNEVLLDYFVGEHHAFLYAKSSKNQLFKVLDSTVTKQLPLFLEQFYNPEKLENNIQNTLVDYVYLGNSISTELLPPKEFLNGIKQLIIVPDGILSYLPFEALLQHKVMADTASFSNLPYLLKFYNIRYAYNLAILSRQEKASTVKNAAKISAFAPLYSNESLEHIPLPGAIEELTQLENKFAGKYVKNRSLNKNELLADIKTSPKLLHLAMHAFAPDSSEAYLLLSSKEERIFMHELMLLPLSNTQLLVLSACQTGMGSFRKGEGLMSLGRGFAHSGVASMVTTLWPLHDRSAAKLMGAFYHYLDKGNSKSEAMRRAKLDFIADAGEMTAHPIYWASPILWGNDKALKLAKKESNYLIYFVSVFALLFLVFLGFIFLRKRA
jgi:CHAT domain-containing protein